MLSAKTLAAVKAAVTACNIPEIKNEILCGPESNFDLKKKSGSDVGKKQWNDFVIKKASVILKNLSLPENLEEEFKGVILSVGMRMLIWARYHEIYIGFSRNFSINFLNSSLFTQQGIVDYKMAAEELMSDKNLSIQQKYKIACLYCFRERIPALYKQLKEEDKEKFYSAHGTECFHQPDLIKFWSYYLMGEVDKLKGGKSLDQYRLEIALKSGNIAAVQFCFEKTKLRLIRRLMVDSALITARIRSIIPPALEEIVFRDEINGHSKESWIPVDYYTDVLCFLLLKMTQDQQIEFLKSDIGDNFLRSSRVLKYLLDWPYHDYFMKMANMTWEFLPECSFAELLFLMCDKIEPEIEANFRYGEEKSCDYRKLIKKFWVQSPERFKTYIFSKEEVIDENSNPKIISVGRELLVKLFTLNKVTVEDEINIGLILSHANDEEKQNIIYSEEGGVICSSLMMDGEIDLVNKFALLCLSSQEKVREFKKNFAYRMGCLICEKLILETNIENDEKMPGGMWEDVEKFVTWCFSSEEEIRDFKRNGLLKRSGAKIHFKLIESNQWTEAETFFAWLGLSSEEIRELKKETVFNYSEARQMFRTLIYSEEGDERFILEYGNREETIELFLRWYFTDKESLIEMKYGFMEWYCNEVTVEYKARAESFYFAIEQRLSDLDKEQNRLEQM